jgi:non-heme chloroperoxidase
MSKVITKDGTEIFYKDWGTGQPLFFHHGWPLSADDWDAQMMFFLGKGYRVIAHDRRGHGRSSQTANGHDMDTYAADVAEVVKALDLKDAIHIGHSTGGGEVTRYVAKYGKGRVAKAVLISAIPPTFMKSDRNPDGVPKEVVDGIRDGTANHRSQFYKDITMPFYGFNRPGAVISEGIRELVAAGHDGEHPGPVRMRQGPLRDRVLRRSQGDRRSGAGDARRGRPDLSLHDDGREVGEAPEERDAQILSGPAARHAHDACRPDQCRPVGLHTVRRRRQTGGLAPTANREEQMQLLSASP